MTNTAQVAADRIKARRAANPAENVTAPIDAHTLTDLVELVDRFGLASDSTIDGWDVIIDPTYDPHLDPRAVVRWDRATIVVRDADDLRLARFVVLERARARQHLRRHVLGTAIGLGLEPSRFTRPATGHDGVVIRCPGCRTTGAPNRHAPGGEDCQETRRERAYAMAD